MVNRTDLANRANEPIEISLANEAGEAIDASVIDGQAVDATITAN